MIVVFVWYRNRGSWTVYAERRVAGEVCHCWLSYRVLREALLLLLSFLVPRPSFGPSSSPYFPLPRDTILLVSAWKSRLTPISNGMGLGCNGSFSGSLSLCWQVKCMVTFPILVVPYPADGSADRTPLVAIVHPCFELPVLIIC